MRIRTTTRLSASPHPVSTTIPLAARRDATGTDGQVSA